MAHAAPFLRATAPRTPIGESLRKARRLVDAEMGMIRAVYEVPCDPDAPQIFGYASIPADTERYGIPASGSVTGSTSAVRERAIAGAVGEAIERYSASVVPDEELLTAPYSTVRDRALDPRTLVLYREAQYRCSGFPYPRFRDDMTLRWAEGYSLTRDRPVLVPAFAAYMPYALGAGELPLVQLITTGLACGNSREEAILSGLCEVIERDATMTMWLRRSPPALLCCDGAAGPLLRETLRRFARSPYDVRLLDATTDLGIPAIVAVAQGKHSNAPNAVFASKASLDPQHAAVGALDELAQCIVWVKSLMAAHPPESLPDLKAISSMEEHVLWATHPDRRRHFAFVVDTPERRDLASIPTCGTGDVAVDIRATVARLAAHGLEVIAVDVTPPDIREAGFHTVRVIVPGAQPLTFGHGLERISDRVRRMGDQGADEALNLWPHPFP